MEITDIKAWQWAIIGSLIGLLLGATYRSSDAPSSGVAPYSFGEFARALGDTGSTEKTRDMPLLRKIVVYPSEKDPNGIAYQRVRLEQLNIHKQTGEPVYIAREFHASSQRDFTGHPSMESWIDATAKERSSAWTGAKLPGYSAPLSANASLYFTVWAVGGAVILGVVWPALMWALLGTGIASKPAPKPKKFKLSSYKPQGDVDDGVIRDSKKHTGMTTEDQRKLDEVMAQLERNTAGMQASRDSDSVDEDAAPTPPPRVLTLNTGPLAQEVNAKPAEPQEEKHYGGEWYPVVKPTHKHE